MNDPKPDMPLLRRVLEQIDKHPETWEQGTWAERQGCDTVACIAGWTCMFSGRELEFDDHGEADCTTEGEPIRWTALMDLGITDGEANELFYWLNTRAMVQIAANRIATRAGEPL